MAKKKVCVFVAGSWGTALACVLAANGHEVMIWSRSSEQVDEINNEHRNHKFLEDHPLHVNVKATTSMEEAAFHADAILLAAPSSAMRQVTRQLQPFLAENTLVIHAAKGFETGSLLSMSKVIAEELPQIDSERIVVLSGPSHAEEVIVQCPTTIVVAAASIEAAQLAQDLLMNNDFRVYTNVDIQGVELAGALKNIIAIGSGMVDGLSFGDNAKAALITRGLAEITRLGVTMGANPLTFSGLAGVGDLIVTCTSQHSRNWRAGYQIAQGKAVQDVLDEMGMVVEGVKTTNAAMALSRQYDVAMPITEQLYLVLFEGKNPKLAVEDLMGRGKTNEDQITI
jgi:glycerol-3-phosphate dehydrogenase (NAD(P)+)